MVQYEFQAMFILIVFMKMIKTWNIFLSLKINLFCLQRWLTEFKLIFQKYFWYDLNSYVTRTNDVNSYVTRTKDVSQGMHNLISSKQINHKQLFVYCRIYITAIYSSQFKEVPKCPVLCKFNLIICPSTRFRYFTRSFPSFTHNCQLLGEFTMVSQPIRLILVDWFVFHFCLGRFPFFGCLHFYFF